MKQAPGRLAPRRRPPGAGATRNDAGPGEQAPSSRAAGSRAPRCGQHTTDVAFGTNETFHVNPLGKTDCGRVSTLLHAASPRRAINPISVEGACAGSHDLDTCGRTPYGGRISHPRTPSNSNPLETLRNSGNPLVLQDPDLDPRSQGIISACVASYTLEPPLHSNQAEGLA